MSRSAKVVTPASGVRLTTGSQTCKHFFNCLDTDGTMRDVVGGVKWTPSLGGRTLTYDSDLMALSTDMIIGNGGSDPQWDFITLDPSGEAAYTWPETSAIMAIAAFRVVDITKFRLTFGDPDSTQEIAMTGNSVLNFHSIVGSTGAESGLWIDPLKKLTDTSLNGKDIIHVLHFVQGTGVTKAEWYDIDTGVYAQDSGVDIVATSAINTDTTMTVHPAALRFSGINLYGAAYYEFTDNVIPANWKVGSFWSGASWRDGHRFLYPGFG